MRGTKLWLALLLACVVVCSGCAVTRNALVVSTQVHGVDVSYVLEGVR